MGKDIVLNSEAAESATEDAAVKNNPKRTRAQRQAATISQRDRGMNSTGWNGYIQPRDSYSGDT